VCSGEGEGDFVSVDASMAAWAAINGCTGEPTEAPLDNPAADGLTTSRFTWPGCAADTELLRVAGGGHAWPGGWQYLSADTIGPVTTDFSASREAWVFMAAHRRGD
jgi:polyhydroxybutyrate depolymerase